MNGLLAQGKQLLAILSLLLSDCPLPMNIAVAAMVSQIADTAQQNPREYRAKSVPCISMATSLKLAIPEVLLA